VRGAGLGAGEEVLADEDGAPGQHPAVLEGLVGDGQHAAAARHARVARERDALAGGQLDGLRGPAGGAWARAGWMRRPRPHARCSDAIRASPVLHNDLWAGGVYHHGAHLPGLADGFLKVAYVVGVVLLRRGGG
jgi:hypothetical protein